MGVIIQVSPPPDLAGDMDFFCYAVMNPSQRHMTTEGASVSAEREIKRRTLAQEMLISVLKGEG